MKPVLASACLILAVVATRLAPAAATQSAPSATCDRACLIAAVDSYLTAAVAHDPSRIALARNAKFTENAQVIGVGEGVWKAMKESPNNFKLYVPDPVSQQVGYLGVISVTRFGNDSRGDYPILFALRLKIQSGQITESEVLLGNSSVISSDCDDPTRLPDQAKERCGLLKSILPNLETVRPGLLAPVPPAERVTRQELLRFADSYYDSLVRSDGRAAPFADDCVRRENGVQTTSASAEQARTTVALIAGGNAVWGKIFALGCAAQMTTGANSYITSVARRVQIADPETGLVFGLAMFHRTAPEQTLRIVGVPGVETIESSVRPSDRLWAHVFKVRGGKLHEIEAMGAVDLPLNSSTGWEGKR